MALESANILAPETATTKDGVRLTVEDKQKQTLETDGALIAIGV